jgi:hypothetical protein
MTVLEKVIREAETGDIEKLKPHVKEALPDRSLYFIFGLTIQSRYRTKITSLPKGRKIRRWGSRRRG